MKDKFLNWAKENGWTVEESTESQTLPTAVAERYPDLPAEWYEFTEYLKNCADASDTVWFLMMDGYSPKDENEWQYNEFERISLEAADGDERWTEQIQNFWNGHFPIVMSVRDGYAYYAIRIADGSVVSGAESEFEETEVAAESFGEFLQKVISGEIQL